MYRYWDGKRVFFGYIFTALHTCGTAIVRKPLKTRSNESNARYCHLNPYRFLRRLSFSPSGTGRVMQGGSHPSEQYLHTGAVPSGLAENWPAANKQVFQAFHQFTFDDL